MSIAFPIVSWGNGTNIYEVNVRQYTKEGTFQAFIKHIPRLANMGIDVLWLMPVTPISEEKKQGTYGSYYAASSYTDVHKGYGNAADFKELIQTAHSYGMKVIIDWVANHTGYDHHWTTEHADWYRKDEEGNFTEFYGWIDVIDLNYENEEMRREMIQAMKFWIKEFDIDGFRADMARTVPLDFWIEARAECDTLKPLLWLGECEILEYHEAFDITYGWLAMRGFDKYFQGNMSLDEIKDILVSYTQYPIGSRKLLFTSNHDENSYHGTEYEKYGVAAKALAAFTCTFPGIPLIYSGQEKPNLKRLEFFEKDFIDWEGECELQGFYTTLLTLRKKNKALQESASVYILKTDHPDSLAYICRRQNDKVLVLMNLSNQQITFNVDHPAITGEYIDLFTGRRQRIERRELFTFDPGEFIVYHITFEGTLI